jgi:hypothetical protein
MPEQLDGKAAFERVEALLEQEAPGERLPNYAAAELLKPLTERLAQIKAQVVDVDMSAHWTAATSARAAALWEEVSLLLQAAFWVEAQYLRQTGGNHPIFDEARALRRAAGAALDTLEAIGLVKAQDATAIRAGKGYADLAGDLQTLGPLLLNHWAVLEPLQVHQPEAALRLTRAMVERLAPAGAELLLADRGRKEVEGRDWRAPLLRLQAGLARRWDELRALAAGGLAAQGQIAPALQGYPSLRAQARA